MSHRPLEPGFAPGEVILGKYRVLRVVGAGGMDTVLEAENLRTSRTVAIKVLAAGDGAQETTATQ